MYWQSIENTRISVVKSSAKAAAKFVFQTRPARVLDSALAHAKFNSVPNRVAVACFHTKTIST